MLIHAVDQILYSPGAALGISVMPLVLLVALTQGTGAWLASSFSAGQGPPGGFAGAFASTLLAVLAGWVLLTSVAVRWHRFVLRGEKPSDWLPRWHGGRVAGYMLRGLLIGVVVGLPTVLALLVVSTALARSILPLLAAVLAIQFAAGWAALRLSASLPAVALGERMGLGEAWAATAPASGAVALLVAILALGDLALDALVGVLPTAPGLVVAVVAGWAALMLGIAVLTTLYGHLAEGRPLSWGPQAARAPSPARSAARESA